MRTIENLRIPYMGSKQSIAEKLLHFMISQKPNAKYFIDLFGGGASMSFKALQMEFKVIYNEYNKDLCDLLQFILNRINNNETSKYGLFPEEWYNFVSKEEFKKQLKEHNPYSTFIKICYSFGNKMKTYAYGDIEEFKKQVHNFLVFNCQKSKEYLKNYFKDSLPWLFDEFPIVNWQEKRKLFVNNIIKIEAIKISRLYNDIIYNKYKDYSFKEFNNLSQKVIVNDFNLYIIQAEKKEVREQINNLIDLKRLNQLKQSHNPNILQHLENIQQLESLKRLENLENLKYLKQLQITKTKQNSLISLLNNNNNKIEIFSIQNKSYEEIDLSIFNDDEVIIYCDPPYRTKTKYNNEKFDYKKFDDWLINQDKTIFLSEYNSPFKEIFSIDKQSLLGGANKQIKVQEKLFIINLRN